MQLSAYEQKILQSLEEDLSTRYPVLERRLKSFANRPGRLWMAGVVLLCLVPGLGLMFLGLCIGSTWVSVLAFIVLNGGGYLASMIVNPGSSFRLHRTRISPPSG